MYNMTNVTSANNVYEITKAVNDLSGGWFVTFVVFILFFILIMTFYKNDMRKTMLAASFIMVIINIVLYSISFVPISLFTITTLIYGIFFVWVLFFSE